MKCLLSLVVACTVGCTGTDVGNPIVDVDFEIYNNSYIDEPSTVWAPGDTIEITGAWISVERVRLRDAVNCNGQAEIEREGPFVVDLTGTELIAELTDLPVTATSYCRFELRWKVADAMPLASGPPELANASIVIKGKRGDQTPFVVRSTRNDELRLEAVDGQFSISDTTNVLFVGFDAKRLFDGVDLDGATPVDGVIQIEPGSNDAQLASFDDNMDAATELFDDDDGDGKLDPDERDFTDALAN